MLDSEESLRPVCISLDNLEVQFLLTVLRSSTAIMTALLAFQEALPGMSPPPFTADAIVDITALAEKIAEQAGR